MELTPIVPVIELKTHEKELRTKSVDVDISTIKTPEFQKFLELLYESMLNVKLKKGWMHAGISAVQINKHINIFYAYNGNSDEYQVFINPELELMGEATDIKDESCLSILETKGKVKRHKTVKVTFYDENGLKQKEKYKGWNARVIQHEYDHLQGILFIDKLEE